MLSVPSRWSSSNQQRQPPRGDVFSRLVQSSISSLLSDDEHSYHNNNDDIDSDHDENDHFKSLTRGLADWLGGGGGDGDPSIGAHAGRGGAAADASIRTAKIGESFDSFSAALFASPSFGCTSASAGSKSSAFEPALASGPLPPLMPTSEPHALGAASGAASLQNSLASSSVSVSAPSTTLPSTSTSVRSHTTFEYRPAQTCDFSSPSVSSVASAAPASAHVRRDTLRTTLHVHQFVVTWPLPSWLHVRFFEVHGRDAVLSRAPPNFTVGFNLSPAAIEFVKQAPPPQSHAGARLDVIQQYVQVVAIDASELQVIQALVDRLSTFGPLELRTVTPYLSVTPLHAEIVMKKLQRREAKRCELVVYQPDWSSTAKLVRVRDKSKEQPHCAPVLILSLSLDPVNFELFDNVRLPGLLQILILGPRHDIRKARNEVRAYLQGSYHEQHVFEQQALRTLAPNFWEAWQAQHCVIAQTLSVGGGGGGGGNALSRAEPLSAVAHVRIVVHSACPCDARSALGALRTACSSASIALHTELWLLSLPAIWLVYVRDVVWPQLSADATDAVVDSAFGVHFVDAKGQISLSGPAAHLDRLIRELGGALDAASVRFDVVECIDDYPAHHASIFALASECRVAAYVDSRSRSLLLLANVHNTEGLRAVRAHLMVKR